MNHRIGWGVITREVRPNAGRTVCAYPHRLFSSEEAAQGEAVQMTRNAGHHPRYAFDAVEVFIDDQCDTAALGREGE